MGRIRGWKPHVPFKEGGIYPVCSWKNSVRLAFGRGRQDRENVGAWKTGQQVRPPSGERRGGSNGVSTKGTNEDLQVGDTEGGAPGPELHPVLSSGRQSLETALTSCGTAEGWVWGKEQYRWGHAEQRRQ